MSILYTHRTGITYLEHCRVNVNNERLTLIRKEDAYERHWAIPFANIAALLLGPGTSLTNTAAKLLGSEGVIVAFTGGHATPVHYASLSEYREPKYCQQWAQQWFDPAWRLQSAKYLQSIRCKVVGNVWQRFFEQEEKPPKPDLVIKSFTRHLSDIQTTEQLLSREGEFTKSLYKVLAKCFLQKEFTRQHQSQDKTNRFLDQGNYLAYGLATVALWALGISFAFPLVHGKTRRGGLVFDIADVIKDGCVMPVAFKASAMDVDESTFRKMLLENLEKTQALLILFDALKTLCEPSSTPGQTA